MTVVTKTNIDSFSDTENVGYRDGFEHIADELLKLDAKIRLRLARFNDWVSESSFPLSNQQPFVSTEEANRLCDQENNCDDVNDAGLDDKYQELINVVQAYDAKISLVVEKSIKNGVYLPLIQLEKIFGLSDFEMHVVITCLASELDGKYDRLYAYLQDDITRKNPSIDLALQLYYPFLFDRWAARPIFNSENILFKAAIVTTYHDRQSPSGSSGLSKLLALDERILRFILGNQAIDGRIGDFTRLEPLADEIELSIGTDLQQKNIDNLVDYYLVDETISKKKVIINLWGDYGVGKRTVAKKICRRLNAPLLIVEMERLPFGGEGIINLLQIVFRESLLQQAVLYLRNYDSFLDRETTCHSKCADRCVDKLIEDYGWLVIFDGTKERNRRELMENPLCVYKSYRIPMPNAFYRDQAWLAFLERYNIRITTHSRKKLAEQFILSPGQIRDAVKHAEINNVLSGRQERIKVDDLYLSSAAQSSYRLSQLAIKMSQSYSWQDIVLPPNILTLLKTICSHVKHTNKVFEDWGFNKKLAYGRGVSALLSGAPGTGKTMAAQVIASELAIDLYKIDLSNVISKYIGETEKNLNNIFSEAENSNVILMFDECDALFGKRTEISDAHDRYANIEVSYLLQKMEEYSGIVLLTTNFKKNIDEAFVRRIRFIIDFPFPDMGTRKEIWERQFPISSPLAMEMDFEFMAKKFSVSGGNIKNIALNAAFLAAENGEKITMAHLLDATQIEYEKIGKLGHGIEEIKNQFQSQ